MDKSNQAKKKAREEIAKLVALNFTDKAYVVTLIYMADADELNNEAPTYERMKRLWSVRAAYRDMANYTIGIRQIVETRKPIKYIYRIVKTKQTRAAPNARLYHVKLIIEGEEITEEAIKSAWHQGPVDARKIDIWKDGRGISERCADFLTCRPISGRLLWRKSSNLTENVVCLSESERSCRLG